MSLTPLLKIYCHGLPGSAAEIKALNPEGELPPLVVGPLDLGGFDAATSKEPNTGVHLIGFSLGAMTAIQVAAQRPARIKKLTLIAPAAPLELGDFLPHMVGQQVFKIAKFGKAPFKLFTAIQSLGVRMAGGKIIKTMFAGSPDADMYLLSDSHFHAALLAGLQQSLGAENKAYRRAINHYVAPWADALSDIKCPVTLHHGDLDNWAPIDMSYALQKAIPTQVELIRYEGLGHYSTLQKAFPQI